MLDKMKMKNIFGMILLLLTFCFVSCNKETEYYLEEVTILEELPVFYSKYNQNELISKNEIINKVLILNSCEDVQETFSKEFLAAYPSYLQVDYDKYSLLVRTAPVDYNLINRNIRLLRDKVSDCYRYQVDYRVGDICDENDFYVERTAIVINKIDQNSKIEVSYSISKYVENEW